MGKNNPGMSFETLQSTWLLKDTSVNLPAVNDCVQNLERRGRDKVSQIAQLIQAVKCLDLTTLCGDDTCSNVDRLCHKAENPIQENFLQSLGIKPSEVTCAAVCVYPSKVSKCVETLSAIGSSVPVAAVAAGFPSGQYHLKTRIGEIVACISDGAKEIDIVISRDLVLCGEWKKLYDEVQLMRKAADGVVLKTIISAGELASLTNVYKTSLICMAAGADFIKTSTGKEAVNATLPIGMVMARAIRSYNDETGFVVGFKPAGGIRSSKDVFMWQELILKELDDPWLSPDLFRIGASSLLGDIEETLAQFVTQEVGKPSLPYL